MTIDPASGLARVPGESDARFAARGLEALFVRQLLAQARPSEPGMLDGGFAGETFRGMLDEAMSDAITAAGGLGMADSLEAALGGDPEAVAPRPAASPTSMLDHLDRARADAGELLTPVHGRTSSGFGPRPDPLGAGTGYHTGLDIAAPTGTPVAAAAAGVVVHAGPAGGYGNLITVRHADGSETRYGHLSEVRVAVGDRVAAGAAIGAVGSTGRSTGPHLHFEVRVAGKAVDPRPYLDHGPGPGRNSGPDPSTGR